MEDKAKLTLNDIINTIGQYARQNELTELDFDITVNGINYSILYRDERAWNIALILLQ